MSPATNRRELRRAVPPPFQFQAARRDIGAHLQPGAAAGCRHRSVATITTRLAAKCAENLPLALLPMPIAMPPMVEMLQWHKVHDYDPAHQWFRRLLKDAVNAAAQPPAIRAGRPSREQAVTRPLSGRSSGWCTPPPRTSPSSTALCSRRTACRNRRSRGPPSPAPASHPRRSAP